MSKHPSPLGKPFGVENWDSSGSKEAFQETQRILSTIPGGSELLEWCGGLVSFHDAEIVQLVLDRNAGCHLELALQGRWAGAMVRILLSDWTDVSISGFSQQNVIGELLLREADERPVAPWERGVGLKSGDHEIRLMPILGAYGTIRATIAKIELAVPRHP